MRLPLFSIFHLSLIALLLPAQPLAHAAFDPELEDNSATEPPKANVPLVVDQQVTSAKVEPYKEDGPMNLEAYVKAGKTPAYIRINQKGYNIRTTPDFTVGTTDNIDFQSQGADLMAVESVKPMELGAAVQIHANGGLRWVYVPYKKKDDFQFCESEACFTAMANSLDFFLKNTGVTHGEAFQCGVNVGPGGLILPPGAAVAEKEPEPNLVKNEPRREPSAPTMKPWWEKVKGKSDWTAMLDESLEKYGQGLLNQNNLRDAEKFCPNFSSLSRDEKKEFFIHLFNGIAKYESGFKPGKPAFMEPRFDRNGRKIDGGINVFSGPINKQRFSMGLFQMSYKDADYGKYRPGCSGINWERDRHKRVEDTDLTIYDPKVQMDCAVTVMNRWLPVDGVMGSAGGGNERGGARYWSVLRDSNPASRQIRDHLSHYKPCGFGGRRRK